MCDSSPRKANRRADLFAVPYGPLPELIEWPTDPAEDAALRARLKETADELRALESRPDHMRWQDASAKILLAIRYYLETHADAVRKVNGRTVYSDGFRRFVVALAAPGKPAEGMPPAELAYATIVPQAILEDWLGSESGPG